MNIQKIIIAIFLLLLIAATEVHAEKRTCKNLGVEGICIELEFASMKDDYKTPSEYKFPDLIRINEWLVINKITVINKPGIIGESKNAPEAALKIDAYPFEFERKYVEQLESTQYSTIDIPPLEVNDVYELTYLNEWGYYEAKLNNQVIEKRRFNIYPKKLFIDGSWIIEDKIEQKAVGSFGYTTLINGEWRNNLFKVYSNSEIKDLETAENNLRLSIIALIVAVIVLIVSVFALHVERRFATKQEKIIRKQEKIFNNMLEELRVIRNINAEKMINEQNKSGAKKDE